MPKGMRPKTVYRKTLLNGLRSSTKNTIKRQVTENDRRYEEDEVEGING